jgi:hypothetical protein
MVIKGKEAFERDKLDREFALAIHSRLPDATSRRHAANRLAEIAEYAINPSLKSMKRLATDSRIVSSILSDHTESEAERAPKRRIKIESEEQ